MYDNNSDPGGRRGNRGGKGNRGNRQGRRDEERDGGAGSKGGREREWRQSESFGNGNERNRNSERRRNPPEAAQAHGRTEDFVEGQGAAAEFRAAQRAMNRQRFVTGGSNHHGAVPPPPPPPDLPGRGPPPGGYAQQGRLEGERRAHQVAGGAAPAAGGAQQLQHRAQNVPMAPRSNQQDLLQNIQKSCQNRNLSNVVELLQYLEDDEREQIWPLILQDVLHAIRAIPNQMVEFTCEDAADLMYLLGRITSPLQNPEQQSVQEIAKITSEFAKYKAEDLTPRAISRMVWGFAQLSARSDPLMSVVAAEVVKKIQNFKHQELSNTAWAFAKCGLWNEQLAKCLATQCLENIGEFSTESLSNVAWAMAQWSSKEEQLLLKMSDALMSKPDTHEPQHMATLAWAFSTLSFRPESLLKTILQESTRKISQFTIKEMAHVAWAFANLRLQDPTLYSKIEEQILLRRNQEPMAPTEIGNIAWAFAKNHLSNSEIMNRLAREALNQIGGFKAAEITMLTWAYAVSNLGHRDLMTEIGTKVSQRCTKFTPGQLAHITWAFGALSLKHEHLCDAVAKCCQADMARAHTPSTTPATTPMGPSSGVYGRDPANANSYNANSLTQVVWGFAMVQYRNTSFLHEAATHICKGIDMLKPLSLWRCASAYNAMMVNNKEIKEAILQEACRKQQDFSLKGLSRLLDCYNMHIGQKEQENLERVMDTRLQTVAQKLQGLYPRGGSVDDTPIPDPATHQWLIESGFLDLQVQGMKKILQKLEIQTPNWAFVSQCFREAKTFWTRSLVFAMLELSVAGQRQWLVRTVESLPDVQTRRLQMETFPTPLPDGKVMWHVLELACQRLLDATQEQSGPVEGTVQILLSVVPSSNTMALLVQFMAKFPQVQVRFVEVQLNPQHLSNYLGQ